MKTKQLILGLFAAALTFTSCTDDEGVNFQPVPLGAYQNGILVTSEGNFSQGNALVSFISNDFSSIENGVFNNINNTPLGDTAQSISFYNEFAYIVLHGSDKVEVVKRYTFETVTTINTGFSNPRHMAFANGKAYVTNWGDGLDANDDFVAVIDLATNTVTSTITVGEGPEQIISLNNTLYISHKGGWSQGNIVSLINTTDNSVTTLNVGDRPDEMVLDSSNNIWLLCEGRPSYAAPETAGKLIKINTTDNTIINTIDFASTTDHPDELVFENGNLYYAMDDFIYKMEETATTLPTVSIINTATYTMAIKDGKLFTTDPVNYSDPGTLKVFDLSDNSEIQSITVGVNPGGIYFN